MTTRTRIILFALLIALLIVLFLWVDAGITWFQAESQSQTSTGTSVPQGEEYQPTWQVALEVRGEDPALVQSLRQALFEELAHGEEAHRTFSVRDPGEAGDGSGEIPVLLVEIRAQQLYLPVWTEAQVTVNWGYDSRGNWTALEEKSVYMTGDGRPLLRSTGEIEIQSRTVGLFTPKYQYAKVADEAAQRLVQQLTSAIDS